MSTDLLEHFNPIENKNWELYHHNIGLKPTMKYKAGFIVRTNYNQFSMYDKLGNFISTMTTSNSNFQSMFPVPSRGVIIIVIFSSDYQYVFDIFDAKTGNKLRTITENAFAGGTNYGCSADVFENGDIAILNNGQRALKIYNINGELLNNVPAIVSNIHSSSKVMVNSKRKVIAVSDAYASNTKVYNKSEIAAKNPIISFSGTGNYYGGFTQKGNLVEPANSSVSAIRIHKLDYENNLYLGNTFVGVQTNQGYNRYLGTIKDKFYVSQRGPVGEKNKLYEIDESDGALNEITFMYDIIHGIDDKFIYASNSTAYRIYNRQDNSLALSVPSTEANKEAKSNKGSYEQFGKYW